MANVSYLFSFASLIETLSELEAEKSQVQEQKFLLEQELKHSVEREKMSSKNVKTIHTKLEIFESEKSFLAESIKELNEELQKKNQNVANIKFEMEAVNTELAEVKHQNSSLMRQSIDLQSDFQKCRKKVSDVEDRLMKCKGQVDDTNNKLMGKTDEIVNLHSRIRKLEKNNRELKQDAENCIDVLKEKLEEITTIGSENKLLKDEICENDSRFGRMKNQMDKILRERDSIANQMLRRHDEK